MFDIFQGRSKAVSQEETMQTLPTLVTTFLSSYHADYIRMAIRAVTASVDFSRASRAIGVKVVPMNYRFTNFPTDLIQSVVIGGRYYSHANDYFPYVEFNLSSGGFHTHIVQDVLSEIDKQQRGG